MAVAKMYSSPLLMGPPICDELIALVEHMYTEEEASLVRHLRVFPGKTAAAVAAAAHRPVEEVRPVLERLAHEKSVLLSSGAGNKKRYYLIYTRHTCINPFRMRPLYALSSVTALTAGSLTATTYAWYALNPGMMEDPTSLGIAVSITLLVLVIFIWPQFGIHRLQVFVLQRILGP